MEVSELSKILLAERTCQGFLYLLMGGRSRSNSVKENTLQVSSLDPRFAIFIDLYSCDFQAVERLHSVGESTN